jgi:hypothetical protein
MSECLQCHPCLIIVRHDPGLEAGLGPRRGLFDEYVQANASVQQAASLTDFADKALVVLTAGAGSDATHTAAQNHLATLSTNSTHRVVDDATHEGLIADQTHAAVTTQAILDVVASVRSAAPLDQ